MPDRVVRHRSAAGADPHTAAAGTGRGRQRRRPPASGAPGRPTGTSTCPSSTPTTPPWDSRTPSSLPADPGSRASPRSEWICRSGSGRGTPDSRRGHGRRIAARCADVRRTGAGVETGRGADRPAPFGRVTREPVGYPWGSGRKPPPSDSVLVVKGIHEHPRVAMTNSVCNSGQDSTRPSGPATDTHRDLVLVSQNVRAGPG